MPNTPQTTTTPTLAIAWIDSNSNINVSYSTNNGSSWTSITPVNSAQPPKPAQSTNGSSPALAFFGNQLYLAWAGSDSALNIMAYNGQKWQPQQTYPDKCNAGPALAASDDVLCQSHAGNDPSHSLNLWFSIDGSNWPKTFNMDPGGATTWGSPALAVGPFQAQVLAWLVGTGTLKSVNYLVGVENLFGVGQATPNGAFSLYSPALAFYNDLLYMAWTNSNNALQLESSPDGLSTTWTQVTPTGVTASSTGPALAASGTSLYLAWADTTSGAAGGNLQLSVLTNGQWSANPLPVGGNSKMAPTLAYGALLNASSATLPGQTVSTPPHARQSARRATSKKQARR